MTSIALGIFVAFIIYVMIWSIRNDGAHSISDQTGFIRMREPAKSAPDRNTASRRGKRALQDAAPQRGTGAVRPRDTQLSDKADTFKNN